MSKLNTLLFAALLPCALHAQTDPYSPTTQSAPAEKNGMQLVWHDEFNGTGTPDSTKWRYETGFMRNHEAQWYNGHRNSRMDGHGALVIEARKEKIKNPRYRSDSQHWGEQREYAEYTSGSMQSRFTYRYGHVEVRAQLCTATGAWPAIWQVGTKWGWPMGGEIDIMEYYPAKGVPSILGNWCWGSDRRYQAVWNSKVIPMTHFTANDPDWAAKYHIWTLDWTPDSLCIRLDGEVINQGSLQHTVNGTGGQRRAEGAHRNPFSGDDCPENLIWLNLALGGDNGGPIDPNAFPMHYRVDYVRVYQRPTNP